MVTTFLFRGVLISPLFVGLLTAGALGQSSRQNAKPEKPATHQRLLGINGDGLTPSGDANDVQNLKTQFSKLSNSLRTVLAKYQSSRISSGVGSTVAVLPLQIDASTPLHVLLSRYSEVLKSPLGLSAKRVRSQAGRAQVGVRDVPSAAAPNATFIVNRTGDEEDGDINDGKCDINLATLESECTLRAAIEQANANPGKDVINFNIGGGGAQTIKVGTHPLGADLPQIQDPVDIDGTTQPGYAGSPLIELDGTIALSGAGTGLSIAAGNTTVKGLVINRFLWGVVIGQKGSNRIEDNYIGTDISGTVALGNTYGGVFIATSQNTVASNVISGHYLPWGAVSIGSSEATNNLVTGNFIGTDFTGTVRLGNSFGVNIGSASFNSVTDNVISGNSIGVFIADTTAVGNIVQGNAIGITAAGNAPLSNVTGVWLTAPNNLIGGTLPNEGNTISGNTAGGILIMGNGIATGNQIQGNNIGTDPTGAFTIANGVGMTIWDAKNTIGGDVTGAGNVISGNTYGIVFVDSLATENKVLGNRIGTDVSGSFDLGNQKDGIILFDAPRNQIGGTADWAGNVISGNDSVGVHLMGLKSSGNTIEGNTIGLTAAGDSALGNSAAGILIHKGASNTTIGVNAGNVISANQGSGIKIEGIESAANVAQGNFIGTDATGEITDPNAVFQDGDELGNRNGGVLILDSPGNLIGGTTPGTRNVISGNDSGGVWIEGMNATANKVQGNYIGTDLTGTRGLGNFDHGVAINNAPNNTIGGSIPEARNVISSNQNNAYGVEINDSLATDNLVQWNLIGTDVTGKIGMGNTGGVFVSQADNNKIFDNVIAHNRGRGVHIQFAKGNKVQGNYIGTNISGAVDLGNSEEGVLIVEASNNIIGGTLPKTGNVISGNDSSGIAIGGSEAYGNHVLGNFIGTDATGTVALGNARDGVRIGSEASDNILGGTDTSARNIIAFNGGDGVRLFEEAGTGNMISANSIYSNGKLGIDLNADGVTPNDANDNDVGANDLQNYPVITSFSAGINKTTITGTLNSRPNGNYRLEFFSNVSPDPSGFGEGEFFISATNVTTNSNGDADFNANFPDILPKGSFITATATDADNNTSEFARCFIGANPIITKVLPPAAKRGTANLELRVKGVNFVPTTVVSFEPSQGIEVNPPSPPDYGFIGSTELSRRINIASDALVGERQVHVTNPNGESGGIRPYNLFTVTDRAASDLSVTMVDDPDPVDMGSNLSYTITVTHNGPDPATGVALTDNLKAVGRFIFANTTHGSYAETDNIVTCNIGTLAVNDTAKVTITVIASTIPGEITNIVKVTNNEIDADTTNNTAREVTTVKPTTAVEELSPEMPRSFELGQNYPNPFNPTTGIRFSVPRPTPVVLEVYDILGAKVVTLVNEVKPAGEHEVTWNVTGLPSGIYVYRMQAGSFVAVKKMLLLR